jgi:Flp pilus assembly protein TadD
MTPAEIRALSRMLDRMDYYKLLRVEQTAPSSYVVLRDSKRRSSYDNGLAKGALRYTPESEESTREATQAKLGSTPNGQRFHALALEEERKGDVSRAVAHLRMALTFEPQNEHFKRKLEELRAREKAARRGSMPR